MHEIDPALRNTIIVGRAEAELAQLPAGSIPLFLFSPPYNLQQRSLRSGTNVGVTRGERLRRFAHSRTDAAYDQRGGNGKWQRGVAYDGYADRMPWPAYIAWQQDILRRCWNLLTEDGAICYVHKPRLQDGLCTTPLEYNPGLPLRQVVIWKRAGGVNCAPTHFMPTHEWVCIFAKPAFRLRDRAASAVGDVWSIAQEMRTWHPAPFPKALVARIFETIGPQRIGLVCDPFMGSGTTAKVARSFGIDYLGIEQSAAYAVRARREIAAVTPGTHGRARAQLVLQV